MSMKHEENDVYIIPPNFIETGTILGGAIRFRNAVEAVILSLLIGIPVFHIDFRYAFFESHIFCTQNVLTKTTFIISNLFST